MSVQPCLRTRVRTMCGHSWALGMQAVFYDTHWFLNTPPPHTGEKRPELRIDFHHYWSKFHCCTHSQTCGKVREITSMFSLSEGFGCLCLYWFVILMNFSVFQPTFCSVCDSLLLFFFLAEAPIGYHLHSCLARAPTVQLMLWTLSQMCLFQRSGSFEKLG